MVTPHTVLQSHGALSFVTESGKCERMMVVAAALLLPLLLQASCLDLGGACGQLGSAVR